MYTIGSVDKVHVHVKNGTVQKGAGGGVVWALGTNIAMGYVCKCIEEYIK